MSTCHSLKLSRKCGGLSWYWIIMAWITIVLDLFSAMLYTFQNSLFFAIEIIKLCRVSQLLFLPIWGLIHPSGQIFGAKMAWSADSDKFSKTDGRPGEIRTKWVSCARTKSSFARSGLSYHYPGSWDGVGIRWLGGNFAYSVSSRDFDLWASNWADLVYSLVL
jgi:hypothetical protein